MPSSPRQFQKRASGGIRRKSRCLRRRLHKWLSLKATKSLNDVVNTVQACRIYFIPPLRREGRLGTGLSRVFQLDEFVLDAEFLAFQADEGGVVGVGAVDFSFDLDFE